MKRTATVVILLLLIASSAPGAAPQPKDPEPFLVAFTPDAGRIVVATRWAGIRVLSIPDLKEIRSFAVEDDRALSSAAVSPSGRWLALDHDGKDLRIWNLETGDAQLIASTASAFRGYFFTPDDIFIVFQNDTLQVWDVKEARKGKAVDASRVERMALSPDGRYMVVGGMWGRPCLVGQSSRDLCLYATNEMKLVTGAAWNQIFPKNLMDKLPQLADIDFTPDGRIVVTISLGDSDHAENFSRFLAPDDLRALKETNETVVVPGKAWPFGAVRSGSTETVSPDGRWKVTASAHQKRLYLYRLAPDGLVLDKFVPLP